MPIDPDTGREKGDGFMFEVGDRDPVVTGWGGQAGGGGTPPDPGGGQTFADFLALIAGGGLGGGGEQFGMGGMRRRRPQAMPMMRAPIPAYAQGTPDVSEFLKWMGISKATGVGRPAVQTQAGAISQQFGNLLPLIALLMGRHPGGPALVGEEGPEVVDLPPGSSVTPNPRTMPRPSPYFEPPMHPSWNAMSTMPSYANGTPGVWQRQQDLIKRWYGPPPGSPPDSPPSGNNLPAGWFERGNMRPSDLPLDAMFGPNSNLSYPQLLNAITAKSIQGGAFDPLGSQGMAEMARSAITSSMGARERAATLGADMDSGGDPALRAFGRLQARLNTQGEGSNAYVNALLQSARQNQQFLQNLFGSRQASILKKDPKENPWAQVAGTAVGAGIAAIPGMMGGGTGTSRQTPPDSYSW